MPARAKLPPGEGKRVPLNMRTTRETREKLEKSAAGSGRSLAQEVEHRLERSFGEEENLRWAFSAIIGDEALSRTMMLIASVIRVIEEERGLPWREDPAAREEAALLFKDLLNGEAAKVSQPRQSQGVGPDNAKKEVKSVASKLKSRQAPKHAVASA